jgi:hypothetical protein
MDAPTATGASDMLNVRGRIAVNQTEIPGNDSLPRAFSSEADSGSREENA